MPRNGSGIFTLVASYFATAGQTIRTEQHNPPLEDIEQALTDSLPRDGSAAMTGNLPMGAHKITNLGAATVGSDAVRLDQLPSIIVQDSPYDTTAGRLLTVGSFGLGLFGHAVDATNIDTTTTASGSLRYVPGTTGTFPVGVTAASGGKLTITRYSTTGAYEVLQPNNASTMFWRRLETTWQPWQQFVSVPDADVANGDMLARIGGVWARFAKGLAGQVLRQNDALTAPDWTDALQVQAPQVTTSGTAFNFTGIPAWAKRITVICNNVSLSGSDNLLVQIGTSGGIVTTGYDSTGSTIAGSFVNQIASTAGFVVVGSGPGFAQTFTMVLNRLGPASFLWVASHNGFRTGATIQGGGSITLAAALDSVRLTRTGTDTFDGGSVAIIYE